MFITFFGIVTGFAMMISLLSAGKRFGEKFWLRMLRAVILGVAAGVFAAFSPKINPYTSMILLLVTLAAMIYMVAWWALEGSTPKEAILFTWIDFLWALVGGASAARISDLTTIRIVVIIIKVVPWAGFFLSIGFFFFNMSCWKEEINSEDFDPNIYLNGSEKLEDFNYESIFKKFRRWWNEEVC